MCGTQVERNIASFFIWNKNQTDMDFLANRDLEGIRL